MVIVTFLAACSGGKGAPTIETDSQSDDHSALQHTGGASPHHSARPPYHTGDVDCSDTVKAPRTWSDTDDPCAILDGKRFVNGLCAVSWFEGGWFHNSAYVLPDNVRYTCRSEGALALLNACGVGGAFSFDRETGTLLVRGSAYTFVVDDWHDHSGTPLGYWFYTDTGYESSFCDTGQ